MVNLLSEQSCQIHAIQVAATFFTAHFPVRSQIREKGRGEDKRRREEGKGMRGVEGEEGRRRREGGGGEEGRDGGGEEQGMLVDTKVWLSLLVLV